MVLRLNLIISRNLLECSSKGIEFKDLGKRIMVFIPFLKNITDFQQIMKTLDILVGFTSNIINFNIFK